MRQRVVVSCCLVLLVLTGVSGVRLLLDAPDPGPLLRPPGSHHSEPAGDDHADRTGAARGEVLPDGFEVRRLRPGQRPPQFVLVSFDGGGWSDMWEYWFDVAQRVPFRFTVFLSGTYLLSDETRDAYHPPSYPPGSSQIAWYSPDDLPGEIAHLNRALAEGDEIGTHFNGHFCASSGLPSGGDTWTTGEWDTELTQFFHLVRDYATLNQLPPDTRLDLTAADVHGARTPCLEGQPDQLYPALAAHGIRYDSSFSHTGLRWPARTRDGIWEIGMATFPVAGTLPDGRSGVPVTTMDYNYFFTQRGADASDVTEEESATDRDQVLATYRNLYRAALDGNRAPLVLGNHFNDWNHGAYRDALARFVTETCGQPETQCVTYSDLVAWLDAQRPAVLRRLGAGEGAAGSGLAKQRFFGDHL